MLHLLAQPLPFYYATHRIGKLSAFIVLTVTLFLFLFRPVGIASDPRYSAFTASLVFGLLSGIMYAITYGTAALLRVERRDWTLGKELGLYAVLLVVVALSSTIVRHFWVLGPEQSRLAAFFSELSHTALVAIVPSSLIWLRLLWVQLPAEIKRSIVQTVYYRSERASVEELIEVSNITLVPRTAEELTIPERDLLYISADGNYVDVVFYKDGTIKKEVLRITLKEVAEQLAEHNSLVRTHRAYLVNTQQVAVVNGNAAGYKLTIKGLNDIVIPVSRKRIGEFDKAYAQKQQ